MQQQWTILIVEDEPDTADMLAEMARLCGHRVVKSPNGHAALNMIRLNRPDLILLDVMMPGMSGLNLLEHLRQAPYLVKIPVVIISASSSHEDIQRGINTGATAYLTKPITFEELKNALNQVIISQS
jgi:CheY-like chemotaxis protein